MAIAGIVTNTGLAEAVRASSNQGWSIYPTQFGVSANGGELRPTRTDANEMWYQAQITDQTVVSENTIQFVCTIPPQVIETDNHIREIYLFGENSEEGTEFLLAVGQPTEAITYFKDGSITLRMHVTLANVQASQVFEFKYTGHRSIEDHNTDALAHQELFGTLTDQIKSLGEAMLVDGQLATGGAVYIDREAAQATIDEAKFYKDGLLVDVPSGSFAIPLSGQIGVGVWTTKQVDGTTAAQWGTRYDSNKGDVYHEVHLIADGFLKTLSSGVVVDEPVHTSVIRYDREAHGNYIVHGLQGRALETGDGWYTVQVSEGKAHIDGIEVEQRQSTELTYTFDPDTEMVLSERHVFQPDEKGQMAVSVENQPLAVEKPVVVTYTKSATLGVERGQVPGTADLVIENLLEVKAVRYGTSTFLPGRDFILQGATLNWSPLGSEPPTGSLYTVEATYQVEHTVDPEEVSGPGFIFGGAVPGTSFQVKYHTLLPRKDLIVMDRFGVFSRIKGKGDTRSLSTPKAPAGTIALTELTHHWTPGIAPGVQNTGIMAIRADELFEMQRQISDLYDMMAEERIARAAEGDDPRAKRGIFIDPFLNDDQRDGGAVQTAYVDEDAEELTLATDVHTMDDFQFAEADAPNGVVTLPYTLRTVVEQNASTGHMLVNPYMAFDPIPPSIALKPAVDNWTINRNTRQTITRTRQRTERVRGWLFSLRFGGGSIRTNSAGSTRTTNTLNSTRQLPNLRSIRVSFTIRGFTPNEKLSKLTFGGRDVTSTVWTFGKPVVEKKLLIEDNRLLDTRQLYTTATDAVTNWSRNAQRGTDDNYQSELGVWEISNGRLRCSANTASFVTLTSVDTFNNYGATVRIRGEGDDDWVAVVIAAVKVGNTLHTISAVAATRTSSQWALWQNFGRSDARVLKNNIGLTYNGTWNSAPDGITIYVRRAGDKIQATASQFGSRSLDQNTRYELDLRDDPKLAVFRTPCAWGIGARSQRSNFEVLSSTNHGNVS